jgi:hypothetical protein
MSRPFTSLLMLIFALVAGISHCQASIAIRVVDNYSSAAIPETWTAVADSDIPEVLLKNVTIATPSKAYAAPYSKIFLQNDRVIVCYETCDSNQPLHPDISKRDDYNITGDGHKQVRITRLTSVYFWINQLFDRMETLGYIPTHPLTVLVDRDVSDPTSGIELANNAFFNPQDWSLSFLPSHRAIYAKYKRLDVANAANDPSVVMHETVHSIFQSLIGPILNSEVLGLHEAFADYFSLSLLEDPDMGLVAGKGKAIRSATGTFTYSPGMEAHDLGNVVVSVLWRIRSLFKNPLTADQVALETIRQVSDNPYSTAGDVVCGYMTALKSFGSFEVNTNPDLETAIQTIWNSSQLKPSIIAPDLSEIRGPLKHSKAVMAKITSDMPEQLARSFNWNSHTENLISQFEWRAVASDPNQVWYRVGYTESSTADTDATSFWILYDKNTGCILASYDPHGGPITRASPLFGRLIGIGNSLNEMISLTSNFSSNAQELYIAGDDSSSPYSAYFHIGSVEISSQKTPLNGTNITMFARQRKIRPSFVTGIRGRLDPVGLGAFLNQTTSVTLYSVGSEAIHGNMELVPLPNIDKQYIMGYSESSATGATHSLILRSAN